LLPLPFPPPGGATPCTGLYREALAKTGTVFRLQERAGISQVEVYERYFKGSII